MSRTIAIGDIHGCSNALEALLEAINAQLNNTIIPLGDYFHPATMLIEALIRKASLTN